MSNSFKFKQFTIANKNSGLKVGTDGVLLGASVSLKPARRVLDIGTGTGVVALMLAQRYAAAMDEGSVSTSVPSITGIELDREAAAEAAGNFSVSPWACSLECINCSLEEFSMAAVPFKEEERFDLIVCNPPYYESAGEKLMNSGCRDGQRAAARHTDSLSFREVVSFSGDALSDDGQFAVILPKEEENALVRFASSFGFFPFRIVNVRTTDTKSPKRIIAEFSRKKNTVAKEELTIMSNGDYTQQYRELTKDFYLNF